MYSTGLPMFPRSRCSWVYHLNVILVHRRSELGMVIGGRQNRPKIR